MTESKANFITFSIDPTTRQIDLGAYKEAIIAMEAERLSKPLIQAAREIGSACDGFWENVVVAADDNNQAIAFASLRTYQDTAELDCSFVLPPYRRRGIYKGLVEQRLKIAERRGCTGVIVQAEEGSVHIPYLKKQKFRQVRTSYGIVELYKKI